jgi:hypothetical protein
MKQLTNGGNFAIIARNVANLYLYLQVYPPTSRSQKKIRLGACGLINAMAYINKGQIEAGEIIQMADTCIKETDQGQDVISAIANFVRLLSTEYFSIDTRLDYFDISDITSEKYSFTVRVIQAEFAHFKAYGKTGFLTKTSVNMFFDRNSRTAPLVAMLLEANNHIPNKYAPPGHPDRG